jgi:hypothetical protein
MEKPSVRPPIESEISLLRDYVIESLYGALNEQLAPQLAIYFKKHTFSEELLSKLFIKKAIFRRNYEFKSKTLSQLYSKLPSLDGARTKDATNGVAIVSRDRRPRAR